MQRTRAATDYRVTVKSVLGSGRAQRRDLFLRASLISIGAAVIGIVLGNPWLFAWILTYLACEISFNVHARWRLEQATVDARAYGLLLMNYAATVLVFSVLPLFLIALGTPELQFAGFAAVSGFALHALLNHASSRHVVIIHGVAVVFLALAAGVSWSIQTGTLSGTILIILSSLAVSLFFLHTILAMNTRAQEAEANRLALAHAQKMDAVGRLSSGISHDFNNLLTVIAGNLDLMKETATPEDRATLETEARAAVDRGAALVRQLLAASRKSALEVEELNFHQFMIEFESMARRLLPANIEFIQQGPQREDLSLLVDRAQLDSALLNLVINARDAMEDQGGTLWITTHILHLNATSPEVARGDLRRGPYLRIEVEDTGEGIPHHILHEITDPYVTTKPEGKGNGMGLAMVKGFAEQSGGGLSILSTEGEGTSVHLFLPV